MLPPVGLIDFSVGATVGGAGVAGDVVVVVVVVVDVSGAFCSSLAHEAVKPTIVTTAAPPTSAATRRAIRPMFRPNFERPVPGVLKINLAIGTLIECPRSRTGIAKPPRSPGLNFAPSGYTAVVARIAVPRGGRRVPTDTRSGSALPGVELAGRGAAAAVAVRDAWCAASDRLGGVAGVTGARGSARDPGVRDAARSDPACRNGGRRLRVLPDPL